MGLATLGRFELVTQIGRGGMAEVQLAVQRGPAGFEKLVVVKLIHENLAANETFVEMLLAEARVAALLKHPNVVDIYDLGEVDGRFFIAMEYLEGEPLLALLKQGRDGHRLDALSTARLVADTAEGLDAAHELRSLAGDPLDLVHHDVSPGNIVVLYNGAVKLVDFGVARAAQQAGPGLPGLKMHGKIGYMAPEKLRRICGDRRGDIWSLGVVLWEALTLRRLFRGSDDRDSARMVLEKPIPAPSAVCADLPPELDAIVLRALQRDPEERYQTAKQLAEDLDGYLANQNYGRRNKIAEYMQATFASHIVARRALMREVATKGTASADVLDAAFFDEKHSIPGELSIRFKRKTGQSSDLVTDASGAEGTPVHAIDDSVIRRARRNSFRLIAEGTDVEDPEVPARAPRFPEPPTVPAMRPYDPSPEPPTTPSMKPYADSGAAFGGAASGPATREVSPDLLDACVRTSRELAAQPGDEAPAVIVDRRLPDSPIPLVARTQTPVAGVAPIAARTQTPVTGVAPVAARRKTPSVIERDRRPAAVVEANRRTRELSEQLPVAPQVDPGERRTREASTPIPLTQRLDRRDAPDATPDPDRRPSVQIPVPIVEVDRRPRSPSAQVSAVDEVGRRAHSGTMPGVAVDPQPIPRTRAPSQLDTVVEPSARSVPPIDVVEIDRRTPRPSSEIDIASRSMSEIAEAIRQACAPVEPSGHAEPAEGADPAASTRSRLPRPVVDISHVQGADIPPSPNRSLSVILGASLGLLGFLAFLALYYL